MDGVEDGVEDGGGASSKIVTEVRCVSEPSVNCILAHAWDCDPEEVRKVGGWICCRWRLRPSALTHHTVTLSTMKREGKHTRNLEPVCLC